MKFAFDRFSHLRAKFGTFVVILTFLVDMLSLVMTFVVSGTFAGAI